MSSFLILEEKKYYLSNIGIYISIAILVLERKGLFKYFTKKAI